jgi:hypothetical protein
MIESRRVWTAIQWCRGFPVLALMVFLLQGCFSSPVEVEYVAGPVFEAQEVPAGEALVYVYWAPEDSSPADRTWVMPLPYPIRRGTYTLTALAPEANFLAIIQDVPHAYLDPHPGTLKIEPKAGETYFFRLEPRRHLLFSSHFEMRPVEAATALAEIRKCRRIIEIRPSA